MVEHANGPSPMEFKKYQEFLANPLYQILFDDKWKERSWPSKRIKQAPRWCSVDLRDGNQALANPMNHDKKLRFFRHLVEIGFKEIEVGFPAASQTDFDFCRYIIENNEVPDDVHVQVLCQCRESLLKRTVEALKGAKNVVLHIYNSTSELQRRVVFEKPRDGIKALAMEGARLVKKFADEDLVPNGTNVRYEYSPESFTGTELDFAIDICNDIVRVLSPGPKDEKVIINLPATVEMSPPNVYADQIEWMSAHFAERSKVILSLHPHNDRGCGIAAAELGQMAGADRVEGCLFGNGERTGNVCLVTLAINLFSQGVDPELDFRDIQKSIDVAEYCNELKVPERYPWSGSLVYTAFSGSHQDAIKKGMAKMEGDSAKFWEVPYLPIDPAHIGRGYEALVRVNSQSGKGGIAFLLENEYGIALPKDAQIEFSPIIQKITDTSGVEITPKSIYEAFCSHYVNQKDGYKLLDFEVSTKLVALEELEKKGITGLPKALQNELVTLCKPLKDRQDCYQTFKDYYMYVTAPLELISYETSGASVVTVNAEINNDGKRKSISGKGNGPIDAFLQALNTEFAGKLKLDHYGQHDIQGGSGADALCFISMTYAGGLAKYGVGIKPNTTEASLLAITAATNRAIASKDVEVEVHEAFESLCSIKAEVEHQGKVKAVLGTGNGPIAAFVSALKTNFEEAKDLQVLDYSQTVRGKSKDTVSKDSEAVCAIACSLNGTKKKKYGVGLDVNTNMASAKALLSSLSLLAGN